MDMPIELCKVRVKGTCQAKGCSNSSPSSVLCSTCRVKKFREADPVRYAWYNLKSSARKRKIPFKLTLENFRKWAVKHRYVQSKSRQVDGMTVARKNEDPAKGFHGYSVGNIKIEWNLINATTGAIDAWERRKEKKLVLTFDANGQKHWRVATYTPDYIDKRNDPF